MKERMFSVGLLLKASSLLLGIFLVLAVAFYPPVVAAQMVSCQQLRDACSSKCGGEFGSDTSPVVQDRRFGCKFGCMWYGDLCEKHQGEIIKASAQEEMFLVEATLSLLEKEFLYGAMTGSRGR